MKIDKIRESLCLYDNRHPEYTGKFSSIKPGEMECFCDNCFYGRHKLANELLKSLGEVKKLENMTDWMLEEELKRRKEIKLQLKGGPRR